MIEIDKLDKQTMGKNKCGGNKQKAMENSHGHNKHVQYSLHDDQIYVVVTKSLGNSTFQVSDHLGQKYIAHVRGKMKGASKRKYFIQTNDILLVEKRNQTVCDIISLFNDTHHHNILTYPLLLQIIHPSSFIQEQQPTLSLAIIDSIDHDFNNI